MQSLDIPDSIEIDNKPYVELEALCRVERDGERPVLKPHEPSRWYAALTRLAGKAKPGAPCNVRVSIVRDKGTRTVAANRLLWGTYRFALAALREKYLEIGERCPFANEDEFHAAMKYLVLGTDSVSLPNGERLEKPSSTTRLRPEQFHAFYQRVCRWCSEHGVYVPPPEEMFS